MRKRPIALLSLAALLGGLALLALPSVYEVVDRGYDLRPYPSGYVFEIRIADAVTIYADEESAIDDLDKVTSAVLVALATSAFFAVFVLRTAAGPSRLTRFYGIAGVGLAILAVDESFGIHETLGHNLPFVADLPGVDRPDDALFAAMLIPAGAFTFAFKDVMLDIRSSRVLFASALTAFALAGAADIAGSSLDEPLELLVAALILAGFGLLVTTHVKASIAALRPNGPDRPREP